MKYLNVIFFLIMSLHISYTLNKSLIKNKLKSKHKTQNKAMINAMIEAGTKVRSKIFPESVRKQLNGVLEKYLFSEKSDDDDYLADEGLIETDCKGFLKKALDENTKLTIVPQYFQELLKYGDLERDIILRIRMFFKEQIERNYKNCEGRLITKTNVPERYVKEYETARQHIITEVDNILKDIQFNVGVSQHIITSLISTHRDIVDPKIYKILNHSH
jgi:hypothetical protein